MTQARFGEYVERVVVWNDKSHTVSEYMNLRLDRGFEKLPLAQDFLGFDYKDKFDLYCQLKCRNGRSYNDILHETQKMRPIGYPIERFEFEPGKDVKDYDRYVVLAGNMKVIYDVDGPCINEMAKQAMDQFPESQDNDYLRENWKWVRMKPSVSIGTTKNGIEVKYILEKNPPEGQKKYGKICVLIPPVVVPSDKIQIIHALPGEIVLDRSTWHSLRK